MKCGAGTVYSDFEELNAYVYNSMQCIVLDVLIWCLGPFADDSRDYGWCRTGLAVVTRAAVRRCWRFDD
jgi:hypothetical protein